MVSFPITMANLLALGRIAQDSHFSITGWGYRHWPEKQLLGGGKMVPVDEKVSL